MKNYLVINIAAILCLLVVAGSAFYYFVIYPPKHEKERQAKIKTCIQEVDESGEKAWNKTCNNRGEENNCELDLSTANSFDSITNEQTKNCYLKFP